MKRRVLLPAIMAACLCAASCERMPVPSAPPPIELKPVGDGLQVIGFALLGAAVVVTLGRLF